ncbi:MAG: TIR domain-containing protein [Bryobacteraceae bacterium]
MKILVADASIVARHLLGAVFKKWGYEVLFASDGIEAWSILKNDPDVRIAILDWELPGATGPVVCRRLREELDSERYIYAILLTSKSLKDDLIEGMEAGADDYITKPFELHELRVRVRAGLRILDRLGYSTGPWVPIQFHSCFISYSSEDEEIASKLHSDLIARGISCWYAPEDLKIGDKFRSVIDESIKVHDKLLLILSKASIGSRWVETEVEAALEDESRRVQSTPEHLRGNLPVLFPIRIDDTPFTATDGWAAEVKRTRHVGDFRGWRDPALYQKAVARLLRDLAVSDEMDRRTPGDRARGEDEIAQPRMQSPL